MDKIGSKIRKVRELKGYSQEYVAELLGLSQNNYSNIETGRTKLTLNRLDDISKILNIDPIDLLKFDETLVFNNCNYGNIGINNNSIFNNESEDAKKRVNTTLEQLTSLIKHIEVLILDLNKKK